MRGCEISSGEVPTSGPEVGNSPIFANHFLDNDKYSQATHALFNVAHRHNEIQSIEEGVCSIAELIQQVSKVIDEHKEPITHLLRSSRNFVHSPMDWEHAYCRPDWFIHQ